MQVALFTHHFLEPTHHAIYQIIDGLKGCQFSVFAKRFEDEKYFKMENIKGRFNYVKGHIPILNKNNFDIAHAIFDGKTALRAGGAASTAGLPFVLSFHGGFDTHAKIFDIRYTEKTREVVEKADAVTVICADDEIRLRKIGIKKPVDIIPVPINFSIIPKQKKNNPFHLVTVGRFIPKKGIDVALRVLKILPRKYYLTIIGDGPMRNELEKLSQSLEIQDRVDWKGLLPLDKTLNIMNSASILLHPASIAIDGNAEGTPQTILWAQAMGLPIITTPTGSICTIVDDKVTGLLVPQKNYEVLANTVISLHNDSELREKIIRNGIFRVYEHHFPDRIIDKYLNIYKRLTSVN